MNTTENTPTSAIQPYIFFDGRCEEAIEFYKKNLGAETIMMMRFKENPESGNSEMCAPGSGEKIMHATVRIGGSILLASDGRCGGKPHFEGFSLSHTVPHETEAQRVFKALSEGGQVQMPMSKTFFSPAFGMVADKFGVPWMIYVQPQNS